MKRQYPSIHNNNNNEGRRKTVNQGRSKSKEAVGLAGEWTSNEGKQTDRQAERQACQLSSERKRVSESE